MARGKQIDLNKEIPQAFHRLWTYKQERQAAGHDFQGQTYYVAAKELEDEVRNKLTGGEPGEQRGGYRSGIRISTGSRYSLFDLCRKWLLAQVSAGKLQAHNFTRGHVSGARYRPTGAPLSPSEEKHFNKIQKEGPRGENKPIHFADPYEEGWPRKSYCSRATRETNKKKAKAYYRRPSHRTETRTTSEPEKVTCPRCLKLLAEQPPKPILLLVRSAKTTDWLLVDIRDEEKHVIRERIPCELAHPRIEAAGRAFAEEHGYFLRYEQWKQYDEAKAHDDITDGAPGTFNATY